MILTKKCKKYIFRPTYYNYYVYDDGKMWDDYHKTFLNAVKVHGCNNLYYSLYQTKRKRIKITVPEIVYTTFINKNKNININNLKGKNIWKYKDGNTNNNNMNNIIQRKTLKSPEDVHNFLKHISDLHCKNLNKEFYYLSESTIKNVDKSIFIKVSEKMNIIPITSCGSFISHSLRYAINQHNKENPTNIKKTSIQSLLKIMGINKNEWSPTYMTNFNMNCHRYKKECFGMNCLFQMDLIKESFKRIGLKKLIDGYKGKNYIPDAWFNHNNKPFIIELAGMCHRKDYIKTLKNKIKTYEELNIPYIIIKYNGDTNYKKILDDLNKQLIKNNIIKTPLKWNNDLLPKETNFNINDAKNKLLKIKEDKGLFTIKELEKIDKVLYDWLLNIFIHGLNKWFMKEIFPEIDITSLNGKDIKNEKNKLILIKKLKNLPTQSSLSVLSKDTYWELYRASIREKLTPLKFIEKYNIKNILMDSKYNNKNPLPEGTWKEGNKYCRVCPECNNIIFHTRRCECISAYNKNRSCFKCTRKHSNKGISIIQYDLDNNVIKKWDRIKDAGKSLNINCGKISSVCRGNRKTTGGFKWEYA